MHSQHQHTRTPLTFSVLATPHQTPFDIRCPCAALRRSSWASRCSNAPRTSAAWQAASRCSLPPPPPPPPVRLPQTASSSSTPTARSSFAAASSLPPHSKLWIPGLVFCFVVGLVCVCFHNPRSAGCPRHRCRCELTHRHDCILRLMQRWLHAWADVGTGAGVSRGSDAVALPREHHQGASGCGAGPERDPSPPHQLRPRPRRRQAPTPEF